jgi:hypothetical protein
MWNKLIPLSDEITTDAVLFDRGLRLNRSKI